MEPAPDFDAEFETAYGPALTRELMKMPKSADGDKTDAYRLAGFIRESHGDYMAGGIPQHSREEAFTKLEAELLHLTEDRRKHYAGLIRFAVHTE